MQSENILRVVAVSDLINVYVHKVTHRIETKFAGHSGIKAGFLSSFHMQCINLLHLLQQVRPCPEGRKVYANFKKLFSGFLVLSHILFHLWIALI